MPHQQDELLAWPSPRSKPVINREIPPGPVGPANAKLRPTMVTGPHATALYKVLRGNLVEEFLWPPGL